MIPGFQVMVEAGRRIEASGIPDGRSDAVSLMAHAFGAATPRYALFGELQSPLPEDVAQRFQAAVAARCKGQPVAQIIGRRHFFDHWFEVTGDTLDPRPDTETLVRLALDAPFERVLDLGTGTGCILLSLLAKRPSASGLGVDLSPAALAVAERNAAATGVAERARLQVSDWYSAIEGRFDLIVSNPPYITTDEMASLPRDVRDWEPASALWGGDDGLAAYRAILAGAAAHATPGGRLIVEIGWQQGPEVAALFRDAGLDAVAVHTDLEGRDRVVSGRFPQEITPSGPKST